MKLKHKLKMLAKRITKLEMRKLDTKGKRDRIKYRV